MNKSFQDFLADGGVTNIRQLPNGTWAGLQRFLFTYGIMVGLRHHPFDYYDTRFCYASKEEALADLNQWDGEGFPPGNWIKQKPQDILNPKLKDASVA